MLPPRFSDWFESRGWQVRQIQLQLLAQVQKRQSTLLIAPTGAGKTLAGFLPSLVALSDRSTKKARLHTLYISPLRALAVDVARNLQAPIAEMELDIDVQTRTGDTPAAKKRRQRENPPDILLTTPEQLSLLLSHPNSAQYFANLDLVILDELHALAISKRGDLMALALARLRSICKSLCVIGLSATVSDKPALAAYLVAQRPEGGRRSADIIEAETIARPKLDILESAHRLPWAGHSGLYAINDIYARICAYRVSLIFVNTRSQAETLFRELWRINAENLPIALHHGSLDATHRRRVEAEMSRGALRAVVATSSLDLGIDWGDVDLVINVGAPKGISRLAQRIGRANHRLDEPSRALLVPANRFEVIECVCARQALFDDIQDTPPLRAGGLDVLAQHIVGMACANPFDADGLFCEIISAEPYRELSRRDFGRVLAFATDGGYALQSYERYAKLRKNDQGLWRISNNHFARQYRLNVGTIVEAPMIKLYLARSPAHARRAAHGSPGRALGQIEESFLAQLRPGDSFLFAGQLLRLEIFRENVAIATLGHDRRPIIPSFQGGKFPLSTYLAKQVQAMLADPARWKILPEQIRQWLSLQRQESELPIERGMLVEYFPRADKHYLVFYAFEGRLAHQSLGMLLTRRLERAGAQPLGFVANDYALVIWGLKSHLDLIATGRLDLQDLLDPDMLGDDLDAWLAQSRLMRRNFRNCAIIAGLIEQRHPGQEKTGRQMTISSDLIYEVLRKHEPDHILLEASWRDAATGQLDIARLNHLLQRIIGHIRFCPLAKISPLAVPLLMEIGKEPIHGSADLQILHNVAKDLLQESGLAKALETR